MGGEVMDARTQYEKAVEQLARGVGVTPLVGHHGPFHQQVKGCRAGFKPGCPDVGSDIGGFGLFGGGFELGEHFFGRRSVGGRREPDQGSNEKMLQHDLQYGAEGTLRQ